LKVVSKYISKFFQERNLLDTKAGGYTQRMKLKMKVLEFENEICCMLPVLQHAKRLLGLSSSWLLECLVIVRVKDQSDVKGAGEARPEKVSLTI